MDVEDACVDWAGVHWWSGCGRGGHCWADHGWQCNCSGCQTRDLSQGTWDWAWSTKSGSQVNNQIKLSNEMCCWMMSWPISPISDLCLNLAVPWQGLSVLALSQPGQGPWSKRFAPHALLTQPDLSPVHPDVMSGLERSVRSFLLHFYGSPTPNVLMMVLSHIYCRLLCSPRLTVPSSTWPGSTCPSMQPDLIWQKPSLSTYSIMRMTSEMWVNDICCSWWEFPCEVRITGSWFGLCCYWGLSV